MYRDLEKKRKYDREWRKNRKEKWFKDNGPCKCGSWEKLELHHLNPEEKNIT